MIQQHFRSHQTSSPTFSASSDGHGRTDDEYIPKESPSVGPDSFPDFFPDGTDFDTAFNQFAYDFNVQGADLNTSFGGLSPLHMGPPQPSRPQTQAPLPPQPQHQQQRHMQPPHQSLDGDPTLLMNPTSAATAGPNAGFAHDPHSLLASAGARDLSSPQPIRSHHSHHGQVASPPPRTLPPALISTNMVSGSGLSPSPSRSATATAVPSGPSSSAAGSSTSASSRAHLGFNPNNPFQALLNDQESHALISFLDKVSADPNFLFDPKITDGLLNMGYTDLPEAPIEGSSTHPPLVFASDPNFPGGPVHTNTGRQGGGGGNGGVVNSGAGTGSQAALASRGGMPGELGGPGPQKAAPTKIIKTERRTSTVRRESLSEDQKRMNHISSEKRRRDLIKRQFEKMCSMVPKLATPEGSASKSKSAILLTVYEYLVFLVEQNRMIRNILYSHGISAVEIPDSTAGRQK